MNKKMYELGSNKSVIRELYEYGKQRAERFGEENVYDFSIGNPNIPAPESVNETIKRITDLPDSHLYTSAQGDDKVRQKISEYIASEYNGSIPKENIYMTTGAAAALSIVFKALTDEDRNEFIVFAPYFPEYKVFVESAGGVLKTQKTNDRFGIETDGLTDLITPKTAAIILNSPVNPTGNVFSAEELKPLFDLLDEYSKKGQDIYVIADEPYRELVYDEGVTVP